MDKVAIYARVSTLELQDYDRQVSELTREILNQGYTKEQIDTYAEKVSGYKKDRPELAKLLSKAEDYKCIYVSEISRLGRNPEHTREIIDDLSQRNVPVYILTLKDRTLKDDGARNNIMQIILQVLIEFADIESKTMKSRMKSGKLEKVGLGKVSGANQAYGYKNVDGYLVIDEIESVVVEQIYDMYKEGLGIDAIAATLNQMDIPTRLKRLTGEKDIKVRRTDLTKSRASIKWEGATVRQILKNPIYIGKRQFKGHTVPSPQIISEELFNFCNDLMTTKNNRNIITNYTYLLKDMIYCGCCGNKYYAIYTPNPKQSKVYKCTSYIRAKGCGNKAISISLLESVIFNEFINSKSLLTILESPNDLKKQIEAELKGLTQQLKNINSDKENKEAEQSKLLDLYLSSNTFSKTQLEQKQEVLNREIQTIEDKLHLINKEIFQKKRILANYDQEKASIDMLINAKENRTELQAIFKQLIHKVVINTINRDYTLVTFFAKVKGVVLPQTLKFLIYAGGVRNAGRHKSKEYKYIPTLSLQNEPEFENNILQNDMAELTNEVTYIVNQANIQTQTILPYSWVNVPNENWLYIGESDK
ncbi:recombinase family protein [Flavobacterium enshiense]|uniref:recombinase family protein n=1 Tax=Flavobacterium enshiense TaxID=1341165 RepID=UPI00345D30DB